jgi:hypothetical protein
MRLLLALLLLAAPLAAAESIETPEEARQRHERVAERRRGADIICHRGASEFAHENTLEAFRATFELAGDGNEIDVRATRDGVLICFHDDMLDQRLEAFGDVAEWSWENLQRQSFRSPGQFGDQCRIPTLAEVFELHRRHEGLMHLDIKRPGLDKAIAELLSKMDMWDHVGYCNTEHGGVILTDERYLPRRYKGGLYQDRGEVFPAAIAVVLKQPGDGVIVDDPRGVAMALGREFGKLSAEPVARQEIPESIPGKEQTNPLAILRTTEATSQQIVERARAAEQLLKQRATSKEEFAVLEERVRNRALHREWMYQGLDGATALRALILLKAPCAVELARFTLWRDDPELEKVANPQFRNPRAWTDFRMKMVVFPALEHLPGEATERLCGDYLALTDDEAWQIGPPQFEAASRALLAVSPHTETALELMKHRQQSVRGRAILHCLAHAKEPWARAALEQGARHALAYIPPE